MWINQFLITIDKYLLFMGWLLTLIILISRRFFFLRYALLPIGLFLLFVSACGTWINLTQGMIVQELIWYMFSGLLGLLSIIEFFVLKEIFRRK